MASKILRETILTIGPFTLRIIGSDGPRTYFFRVQSSQTDFSTSAGLAAEISNLIVALKQLREFVEEDV